MGEECKGNGVKWKNSGPAVTLNWFKGSRSLATLTRLRIELDNHEIPNPCLRSGPGLTFSQALECDPFLNAHLVRFFSSPYSSWASGFSLRMLGATSIVGGGHPLLTSALTDPTSDPGCLGKTGFVFGPGGANCAIRNFISGGGLRG